MAWFTGPIPQDPAYHLMADRRVLLGIPNCLNVLSNLPFAVVGWMGLRWARRAGAEPAYQVLFWAMILTAAGSGYYHVAPDNARLVWDRLPMAVAFAAILSAVWGRRRALWPLVGAGVGSVLWWRWADDLRPYAVVQFGALLAILVLVLRRRQSGDGYLKLGLAGYAVAKVLEDADRAVYSALGVVSGHTLKHLVAAASVGCIALMLRKSR